MAPKKAETKLEIFKAQQARIERRRILEPPILAVVSALGGFEDVLVEPEEEEDLAPNRRQPELQRLYKLGDECLGCLKDLKKFWRLDEDDEDRTVARILHDSQILPNDLLPILTSLELNDKKDHRVALLCTDLISALTWPIDVASELREFGEIEDEEERRRLHRIDFSGLIAAQLSYKRDIIRSGALSHIFQLLVPSLQKTKRDRTEKDENIISLVLHVIRNLVALRDKPPSVGESSMTIEESRLQSELLKQMSQFGIFDFLILLSHGANRFDVFGAWNIIVLDIWHLIFRGINADDLIDSEPFSNTDIHGQTVSTTSTASRKLESLLAAEAKEKRIKARKAPTRHSRFGTTLSVHTGDRKYNLHRQSDINVPVEQALDAHKKQKKKPSRLKDEFGPSPELTSDAMVVLRKVAIEFIESAFNPFFASIFQDIQMERDKVKETDTIRFMSLFGFFLQYFLLLRDREQRVNILPTSENGHDFDLIASLVEPNCIHYTLVRIQANVETKPMPVVEVHAAVKCLIYQLLVLDGLMATGLEPYLEAANLIQHKLYYDESSLEVVIQLLCSYTTQSHKFLENIVCLASVFLKMLERYSKKADYMFVRKKKPQRKAKAKVKGIEGAGEDAEVDLEVGQEEEAEFDAMEDRRADTYAEHKFEFQKFQARFARESVLLTLMTYLADHEQFTDPEQLKRVVRLLHRVAVNANAESLFYKVSILDTLNSILDSRSRVPRNAAYEDLWRLIDYVLKQFFKSVRSNSFTLVECFFPHRNTKGSHPKANGANSDSEAESLVLTKSQKKPSNLPAEIVVKPGLTWSQKLGVAIGLLVDNNKSYLVENVKDTLRTASAARTAIVLITDGNPDGGNDFDLQAWLDEPKEVISDSLKEQLSKPSQAALEKFEDHEVNTDDEDFKKALYRDAELHLLLRLLKWTSAEVDSGHLEWMIPKARLHTELDVDLKIIDYFLLHPLDHNGKSAAELVKKKRKTQAKRARRSRRASDELNDEERALDSVSEEEDHSKKRKAKKQQEVKKYQSAQFIADSDDEENAERDALFFEQERLLRERINQGAMLGMGAPGADPNAVPTRKARQRAPRRKKPDVKSKSGTTSMANSRAPSPTSDAHMSGVEDVRPSRAMSSEEEDCESLDGSEKGRRTTTTPTTEASDSLSQSDAGDVNVKMIGKKRNLLSGQSDGGSDDDEVDELELSSHRLKTRKLFVLESDEE